MNNVAEGVTNLPSLGEGQGVGLIDGKATAAAIKAEIAEEVKEIMARGGKQPHLAAVLVGHDGGYHFEGEQPQRDCERTEELASQGFKILRFTNEEVLGDIDTVLETISKVIYNE